MFKMVPVVAAFLILQGAFELIAGVLALIYAALYGAMAFLPIAIPDQDRRPGEPPPELFSGIFGGVGVVIGLIAVMVVAAGILKIVAGFHNLRFRKRNLGIAAAISGALSVLTCYCAPTGFIVAAVALVVYLDSRVVRAFELGERGMSSDDIYRTLLNPPAEVFR